MFNKACFPSVHPQYSYIFTKTGYHGENSEREIIPGDNILIATFNIYLTGVPSITR